MVVRSVLLVVVGLLCNYCQRTTAEDQAITVSVFISGITETEEASGFTGTVDGRPFKAAVCLARDLINNDTSLLPGYKLELAFTDAKVSFATKPREVSKRNGSSVLHKQLASPVKTRADLLLYSCKL